MPPQAPSARPRFSGGTAAERIVSVSGITIAPPSPCSGAGDVEHLDARREHGREGRGEREDPDPDREHAAAAEAVAERSAGEEQHGEREGVGVDRPLEALEGRVEVGADHRDRGRHDEVVERDHEQRDRGDRERPQRLCPGRHLAAPFVVSDVVSSHFYIGRKKGTSAPATASEPMQPSISRCAHGSRAFQRSIAAITLSSLPFANHCDTASGGQPRDGLDVAVEIGVAAPHRPRARQDRRTPRAPASAGADGRGRSAPSRRTPCPSPSVPPRRAGRRRRCGRARRCSSMQRSTAARKSSFFVRNSRNR